jgi:predicted metalloendopeptidase
VFYFISLTFYVFIQFDFTSYLRRLYLVGNITLPDDEIVIVNDIEAIRNISSIITQQSPRLLQNYMIWRFIIYRVPNMPKRFRIILDKLRNAVLGISNEQPRIIRCAIYVNINMGFAVSKLYINKYYDRLARAEVLIFLVNVIIVSFIYLQSIEIVDNIRNTFIDMINQSMWIDTVSKKRTIEKVSQRMIISTI